MLVITDSLRDTVFLSKEHGVTLVHKSSLNTKMIKEFFKDRILYLNYTGEDDFINKCFELMRHGTCMRVVRPSEIYALKDGIEYASKSIKGIHNYMWNISTEILESVLLRLPSFWHAVEEYIPNIGRYLVSLYGSNKLDLRNAIGKLSAKYGADLEMLIGSHIESSTGYWGVNRNEISPVTNFKIRKLAKKEYYSNGIKHGEFIIHTDRFGVVHINGEGLKSNAFMFRNMGVKISSMRDLSDLIGRAEFDEYRLIHPGIHNNEIYLPGTWDDYIVPDVSGLDLTSDIIGGKTINALLQNRDYVEMAEKALDTMMGNNLHVFYTDLKGATLPVFKKGMEVLGFENMPTVDFRTVKAMKDMRVSNFFPHFVIAKEFTDEMAIYAEKSLTDPESVPYPIIFVVKEKPKQDIDSIEIPKKNIPMVNLNDGLAWNIYQEIDANLPTRDSSVVTNTVESWKQKNVKLFAGNGSVAVN